MFEHNPETSSIQWRIIGAMVVALVLLLAATSAYAAAGQNKEPWSGQKYDRAGMAVIMHNVDSGSSASSNSIGASTTLVCGGGGGGASSATANSTCIIVNNGAADITTGQASDGGQSASSSTATSSTDQNSMSGALGGLVPGG